jgi:hypothetical protein
MLVSLESVSFYGLMGVRVVERVVERSGSFFFFLSRLLNSK